MYWRVEESLVIGRTIALGWNDVVLAMGRESVRRREKRRKYKEEEAIVNREIMGEEVVGRHENI